MTPLDAALSTPPAPPGPAAGSITDCASGGGPGWYESSRELRCGLDIAVGVPADAPLDDWIYECLRQRNVRPSAGNRSSTASPSSITAIA